MKVRTVYWGGAKNQSIMAGMTRLSSLLTEVPMVRVLSEPTVVVLTAKTSLRYPNRGIDNRSTRI
jgi:hypothetical protein